MPLLVGTNRSQQQSVVLTGKAATWLLHIMLSCSVSQHISVKGQGLSCGLSQAGQESVLRAVRVLLASGRSLTPVVG